MISIGRFSDNKNQGIGLLAFCQVLIGVFALVTSMVFGLLPDMFVSLFGITGENYSLFLASNWGTNCTVTQTASFIGCQDWGGGDAMPFLFDFDSLTASTTNAIEQDTGASTGIWGYARVVCPDASVGYIAIHSGHN